MSPESCTRREFLKAPALATPALVTRGCGGSEQIMGKESVEKPNFIVIFTDDRGYNDLGCFGSRLIKTPNIDRMAKEGVRLTGFYTGALLCAPSRAGAGGTAEGAKRPRKKSLWIKGAVV